MVVDGSERTWDGKYTVAEWWDKYIPSKVIRDKHKLFGLFVGTGDLVFDIGANRGGMTYVFSEQLECSVVAVEPLHNIAPERVKEFHYRFWNNNNVVLVTDAIADTPSIALEMPDLSSPHWIITSASSRWRTQSAHKHLYKRTVKKVVNATTLDALVKRFGEPRFIKVDVEGFDGEVIKTLHTPVYALNMEFHKDWLWNNLMAIRHLDSLAEYEYNYALNNQWELKLDQWMDGNGIILLLQKKLSDRGANSWGDIYARLV